MCEHCGGSGVLNILAVNHGDCWREGYAAACHCPAGKTWKEVGLD